MQISTGNHMKKKMNYRHGYASRSCSDCNSFQLVKIKGIGGADLGVQPRCEWIGSAAGKNYRINPKNICDRFDNSKLLARLNPRQNVPETKKEEM